MTSYHDIKDIPEEKYEMNQALNDTILCMKKRYYSRHPGLIKSLPDEEREKIEEEVKKWNILQDMRDQRMGKLDKQALNEEVNRWLQEEELAWTQAGLQYETLDLRGDNVVHPNFQLSKMGATDIDRFC
jgi:hypothetical protein